MKRLFPGSSKRQNRQRVIGLLRGDEEAALADELAESPALQVELQEFLAGDLLEECADPEFREELRGRLWTIVQARYGPRAPYRD